MWKERKQFYHVSSNDPHRKATKSKQWRYLKCLTKTRVIFTRNTCYIWMFMTLHVEMWKHTFGLAWTQKTAGRTCLNLRKRLTPHDLEAGNPQRLSFNEQVQGKICMSECYKNDNWRWSHKNGRICSNSFFHANARIPDFQNLVEIVFCLPGTSALAKIIFCIVKNMWSDKEA